MDKKIITRAKEIRGESSNFYGVPEKEILFCLCVKEAWEEKKTGKTFAPVDTKTVKAVSAEIVATAKKDKVEVIEEKPEEKIWQLEKTLPGGKKLTINIKILKLNEHDKLRLGYKLEGNESKINDGFYGANYDNEGKMLRFSGYEKIDGKKYAGFRLDDVADEIHTEYERLVANRNAEKEKIIEELMSGERKVCWQIIGCDYKEYATHLPDVDYALDPGILIGKAIKRMFDAENAELLQPEGDANKKIIFGEEKSWIARPEELPSWIEDIVLFGDQDKDCDYIDEIVHSFTCRLPVCLKDKIEIAKKNKIEAEKRKTESAKKEAAQREKDKEEVMFFGEEILSSVGYRMLHSIAAKVEKERIEIYTTNNCRIINGDSTYNLRSELKALGCKFDGSNKNWWLPATEENVKTAIEFLKKHDVKAYPRELGMEQCWECGCWVPARQLDSEGYCGC